MNLEGKTAVITGGSRGIGAAIAAALAEAGAGVIVAARNIREIEEVASSIRFEGQRARAIACNITRPADIRKLLREATKTFGSIGILVNNAGIAASAPLRDQSLEEWNLLHAVNATGAFLCSQAFLPGMIEAGWGRIINIASVAGKVGAPYISAYTASKHAVLGLTRSLAAEVARKGVTVNAICPGYVDTPMTDTSIRRIVEKTGLTTRKARAILEGMSPQNRLIDPEEVAYATLMLCDPRARGINGQAIVIDGGAVTV